jgi:acyl-CoA synthetase (NDP forming)
VKSARTVSGRRGARSPSVNLGVPDHATDALFRQAGVIRVETLEELLDVADVLATQPLPAGRRVAVVGNAGGCGVLAADASESQGLEVPELAPETQGRLLAVVSKGAATANPVALVASATADEYRAVLEIVLADEGVDAVIVTFAPPVIAGADEVAEAVAEVAMAAEKPVLANFVVTDRTLEALQRGPERVPWFAYPESAARALARIAPYAEWRNRPEGTVAIFEDLDPAGARRVVEVALARITTDATTSVWLDAAAAKELLEAYGVPMLACRRARSAAEATAAATEVGYPVVLKLDAPAVVHKSDLGGVRLHLGSPSEVASAAEELLSTFGPGASLVVQPMGPDGVETVVGVVEDPSFGPLVMFGLGGKEGELLGDRMWSLVPMTTEDAHDLVSGIRSSPLLTGYRGAPPADLGRLAELVSRIARLAEDLPEVVELSLDPVVASPCGVTALDARVRVAPALRDPALVRRTMRTA